MSNPPNNWEAIETEEEVMIPTYDGKGIADVIKVNVPAFRDPKTGEIYLAEKALQILDDIKARHMGLISREELRRLRARLRCTQKELCALLQIGEKTWTRWETGRERPSRSMNLLLRALNEGCISVPWLLAQRPKTKPFEQKSGIGRTWHVRKNSGKKLGSARVVA
jgi:DNA-binding transcriptional regulator YiaG